MELKKSKTNRNFHLIEFKDRYNKKCSLQESSLAEEAAIWFGVDDPEPKILASKTEAGGTGWVPYEIPKDVQLTTRMHITQNQMKKMLPYLQKFAETGEL